MTLIPNKHTFVIWQGATFLEILTLYSTMDTSTPRDLTNYSAEMIIRDKPQGTQLLALTTANGRIIMPTNTPGQIQLKISATDTAAITWKTGVYDLTITSSAGVTDALLYGGIKINGV